MNKRSDNLLSLIEIEKLVRKGKIKPSGLKEAETAKEDGRWDMVMIRQKI